MSVQPQLRVPACACPSVEIRIDGDLDLQTVPRLRERLEDALSLRPLHLCVDLTACTFLDATGVTMLLDAHRHARRQDARLLLRGCAPSHLRVFALMGLRDVFDLDPGSCSCR